QGEGDLARVVVEGEPGGFEGGVPELLEGERGFAELEVHHLVGGKIDGIHDSAERTGGGDSLGGKDGAEAHPGVFVAGLLREKREGIVDSMVPVAQNGGGGTAGTRVFCRQQASKKVRLDDVN